MKIVNYMSAGLIALDCNNKVTT
ncbi:hypothetical protein LSEI_0612 [Lacticaseibacillus paracasei ATCC 334]|uniref:Uncharacterized protein n=1 Tax=Lacticaseibacillus paracasei (strain ATCC 334 / BCRC 17002 / CCUG 31169 / CIP 107868 / KCTC 3260 / NRRL B-441) TaxID=321967 RepID=Q03BG8_LACP3|nr:hypothetical protein LSEI_0612 [Lacticaseibacillus paracasei ATCC 334]